MNDQLKSLKGSPKRDVFKWAHKNKTASSFYASDCDLCIVSFEPRGVVAYLDYKGSGEDVTRTETVLYDEWAKTKPVYIIQGFDPENGPFTVSQYLDANHVEQIAYLEDWNDFQRWEAKLRAKHSTPNP